MISVNGKPVSAHFSGVAYVCAVVNAHAAAMIRK